jgi:hypothetical protein
MHIRGLGKQVDLGDQLLTADLPTARAEQHGRDAYGRIDYAAYLTADSRLTRHLILTAEGVLVIRDVLTPGPLMKGWNAGQLWQLYEKQTQGADWFCAEDDGPYPTGGGRDAPTHTRRILVRFDAEPGTKTGVEEIPQAYHDGSPKTRKPHHFWTTFSERTVVPGQAQAFTLVVLPLDPEKEAPDAAAARVVIRRDGEHLRVTVRGTDKAADVTISLDEKAWEVRR